MTKILNGLGEFANSTARIFKTHHDLEAVLSLFENKSG
jgi:hypothetical protein